MVRLDGSSILNARLRQDADEIAAMLERTLSDIPRFFAEQITSSSIRRLSVTPPEDAGLSEKERIASCAKALSENIRRESPNGLQFIRWSESDSLGLVSAWSVNGEYPVRALGVMDLLSGEVVKRFDVMFVAISGPEAVA